MDLRWTARTAGRASTFRRRRVKSRRPPGCAPSGLLVPARPTPT